MKNFISRQHSKKDCENIYQAFLNIVNILSNMFNFLNHENKFSQKITKISWTLNTITKLVRPNNDLAHI